jgi:GTP-binding protein
MELKIVSTEFIRSVYGLDQLADLSLPEIAFIGRSNCGKSTLLNALLQSDVARVSKTPGRTQALNYFRVTTLFSPKETEVSEAVASGSAKKADKYQTHFVDLPGYGFAKVQKKLKKSWNSLIPEYLMNRENLKLIFLLQDSRRTPGEEEKWIIQNLPRDKFQIVLTKRDRATQSERITIMREVAKTFELTPSQILETGITGKSKYGLEKIRKILAEVICRG